MLVHRLYTNLPDLRGYIYDRQVVVRGVGVLTCLCGYYISASDQLHRKCPGIFLETEVAGKREGRDFVQVWNCRGGGGVLKARGILSQERF